MNRIFAKLFPFLLLLLLSSNCGGIRNGEDHTPTQDAPSMCCHSAGDAHEIQLRFNDSHGKVAPIDIDAHYQKCAAICRNLTSRNLPILCTVTNYETEITSECMELTKRTKATVLCVLPAKVKTPMISESSTSYMSRHMYEITSQIAALISSYQWLRPGTLVQKESCRVCDLDIVTFNFNSRHTTQNVGGIIQMAATLRFLTTRPVRYFAELSVAVPVRSVPRQFVNTSHDLNHKETQITGLWIDVFKAATAIMAVNATYKLVPFYGSDEQLLKEVARKTFDAAVGLTVITKERRQLVEFTYPYFEVGPVLVMKKSVEMNHVFSFMIPFTNEMWLAMASITIFTAFVIWLVEHGTTGSESGGDLPSRHVAVIFWFSFATLFNGGHSESPRNSLTYFVLFPWMFLVLVVTSTYTASFTSMITSSETDSFFLVVENLKIANAIIGCDENSFIFQYMLDVIGFERKNIKHIDQSSIDDYEKALSSGNIKAAFFLRPYAGIFLRKYCKDFRSWNPIHDQHGSAVVFPRGSSLASEMSEAMLQLRASGQLDQMMEDLLFTACSSSKNIGPIKQGIGPGPFLGLFILSGGASAIAMFITVVRLMKRQWESFIQRMLMGRGLWMWLTTMFSQNQRQPSSISSTSQTQVSST